MRSRQIVGFLLISLVLSSCAKRSEDQAYALNGLLLKACSDSNATLVELLLNDGADPNITDRDGVTALMRAAGNPRNDNPNPVNILIRKGAEVGTEDNEGRTALMLAFDKGHLQIVWALLNSGANPNVTNRNGQTPLIAFAEKWRPAVGHLEPFLAKGVNVNHRDSQGNTALIVASQSPLDQQWGTDAVAHLIARGADINFQNNHNQTALMVAAAGGRLEIVRLLISKNPNLSVQDNDGKTALMLALENGHYEVTRILLKAGADPNLKDRHGKTAQIYANEHADRMKDLLLGNDRKD